jgi:hypothetical protein
MIILRQTIAIGLGVATLCIFLAIIIGNVQVLQAGLAPWPGVGAIALATAAQSNTKKLLDAFREEIGICDIEELDLLEDVPDMLIDKNLLAHINRNILGQELLPDERKLLSKMDRMAAQLKSTDIVESNSKRLVQERRI